MSEVAEPCPRMKDPADKGGVGVGIAARKDLLGVLKILVRGEYGTVHGMDIVTLLRRANPSLAASSCGVRRGDGYGDGGRSGLHHRRC